MPFPSRTPVHSLEQIERIPSHDVSYAQSLSNVGARDSPLVVTASFEGFDGNFANADQRTKIVCALHMSLIHNTDFAVADLLHSNIINSGEHQYPFGYGVKGYADLGSRSQQSILKTYPATVGLH